MQQDLANDRPAKPDLRSRRRLRTMQSIRKAAMSLVSKHGLDKVTAEMVAEESGISLRTFFNYFTYKEEALIPPPLGFEPAAAETFVSATGPILEDLVLLLQDRLARLEPERENIRVIMEMSGSHPRLQSVRERTFRQYEAEFRGLLGRRLGLPSEHPTPTLMAAVVSASFRVAMHRWVLDDSITILEALCSTLSSLPNLFDPTTR